MVAKNGLKRCRGRPRLYDWAALFGRRQFTLTQGLDYSCSTTAIVRQVKAAAGHRQVRVHVAEFASGLVRVTVGG